ncbi:hypothetical protein ACFQ10_41900 [Streptomyces indonesiensis]
MSDAREAEEPGTKADEPSAKAGEAGAEAEEPRRSNESQDDGGRGSTVRSARPW